jgi:phage replication initiation protein
MIGELTPDPKPPVCNTGALNTLPPSEDRILVDWLEFTLPSSFHLPDLCECLGLLSDWHKAPKGMHGYRTQYLVAGVRILTSGTLEMGHHVIISGASFGAFTQPLPVLLNFALTKGQITRLDLAYDSVRGLVQMHRIKAHISGASLLTPFRQWRLLQSGQIKDGQLTGETLYVGSPQSRLMFRIYDKGLETGAAAADRWMRIECQLRETHAHNAAADVLLDGAGGVFKSICSRYLSFRQAGPDSNKSRWQVAGWWAEFLEGSGKIKLAEDKVQKTLIDKKEWFFKQISPTFAAICQGFGMDEMTRIYMEGARRMSPQLKDLVTLTRM